MRWKRDHWDTIAATAERLSTPDSKIEPIDIIRHVVLRALGVNTAADQLHAISRALDEKLAVAPL
jgi:hypothetical protein